MSTESTSSQPDADAATNGGLLTVVVHHSITVVILILMLALGVWGYLNFQNTEWIASVDRDQMEAELIPPLERAQQQRIEVGIEVHSLLFNSHPTQLDELTSTGLLLSSDLYYPRGPDSWSYQRRGDGFELRPGAE